ncbi:hypothetical protein P7C70_g9603, partial [Phenoliferia sp. Uapishka_3]
STPTSVTFLPPFLDLPNEIDRMILEELVNQEIEESEGKVPTAGKVEGQEVNVDVADSARRIREDKVNSKVLLRMSLLHPSYKEPEKMLREHVVFHGRSHDNERARLIAARCTPIRAAKATVLAHGRLSQREPGVFAAVRKLEGVKQLCLKLEKLYTKRPFPVELMLPAKSDGKSLDTGHNEYELTSFVLWSSGIKKLEILPGRGCRLVDFDSPKGRNWKVEELAIGSYINVQYLPNVYASIEITSYACLRILTLLFDSTLHRDLGLVKNLLPTLRNLEQLSFIGEGAEDLLPTISRLGSLQLLHTTVLFTPATFRDALSQVGEDGEKNVAFRKLRVLRITDEMMGELPFFARHIRISPEEEMAEQKIFDEAMR